jgi:hypothetical protein
MVHHGVTSETTTTTTVRIDEEAVVVHGRMIEHGRVSRRRGPSEDGRLDE